MFFLRLKAYTLLGCLRWWFPGPEFVKEVASWGFVQNYWGFASWLRPEASRDFTTHCG